MSDKTSRQQQQGEDLTAAPGPSTNREQVPGGLEGSIMEPSPERSDADNAGDKPAGDERRTDEN